MKKLCSLCLSLVLLLSICNITGFAYTKENYVMNGVAGALNFSVNDVSRSTSNITVEDNTVDSNFLTVTSDKNIYLEFDLKDTMYFERVSHLPTEKEIIAIKNEQDKLVGIIGIPIITYDDGTVAYGVNSINGSNIVSYNENTNKTVKSVSTRVYIQRDFSYYFSAGNYGYRQYSEDYIDSNGDRVTWSKEMGNFWMRPIASAFNQDQLRYLEVQVMSWDAVDNYFKGFSGTDYTKWINNRSNLKNQYDCHYNYCSKYEEWNLEEWRPNTGYANIVFHGCNVKCPEP